MKKRAEYRRILQALARALRKEPHTARMVMDRFNVSRPVAYARLKALGTTLKLKVKTTTVRESGTGPASKAYSIPRR